MTLRAFLAIGLAACGGAAGATPDAGAAPVGPFPAGLLWGTAVAPHYFHGSLVDNFEWTGGYCPRFGLYHVDYADPARARHAGAGAAVYRRIIDANTVPAAMLAELPGYPAATLDCPRTGL